MAAAARARAAVWDAICRHGYRQLVLDVTGVEFLGSHGLQVLADTAAVTTQGGHGLLRVGVGRRKRVLRPIQLAGLDAVLALHENAEDAIAALGNERETMPDQNPDGVGGRRGPTDRLPPGGSRSR